MPRSQAVVAALLLASTAPSVATAFCSYRGELYAKTTLQQEFTDARWVVHAKVVAADDHRSNGGSDWTIYHLEILDTFKGRGEARMDLFTFRDSGGFYLDKGAIHDLGGEYLLFLNPLAIGRQSPQAARGATEVNYACGQSKPWRDVSAPERAELGSSPR